MKNARIGQDRDRVVEQRVLQERQIAFQVGEAGAGHLRGPFAVDDAEGFSEFDVIFRFEIEFRLLADRPEDDVAALVGSDRRIVGRDVGNAEQERLKLGFDRPHFALHAGQLLFDLLAPLDVLRLGRFVPLAVQLVEPALQFAPPFVQFQDRLDVDVDVFMGGGFLDRVGMLSDVVDVEHRIDYAPAAWRSFSSNGRSS